MSQSQTYCPDLEAEVQALRGRVYELEHAGHGRDEHSLSLLHATIESMGDGLLVMDSTGERVVLYNQRFLEMWGIPPEVAARCSGTELRAFVLPLLKDPEEFQRRNMDYYRHPDKESLDEIHLVDGRVFERSSRPQRVGGRSVGRIWNFRDITDRLRLQRELVQAQKLESIGTLAGGIAHDFNNLLAVIVGQASMQLRSRSLPVQTREALRDILHAAERGSALTQQLLAYARGGLQQPAPVELNAVVESVMKILRRILPPQIEFDLALTPDLPSIVADSSQIEQVVMNLCLNAVQASQAPGRVEVTTESARLNEREAARLGLPVGEYVRLRVRDFGRGMDEEIVERIFEPFFTTRTDGRGMGLAVTLGIIKGHQGHIEVCSARGEGTTMIVWLPAQQQTREISPEPTAQARPAPLPRGSETVLLIDDDPAVGRTVENILTSLGYCVMSYGQPDEALGFLSNNAEDVHLILLDVNLPRYPLEDMFARVRERCPHAPVLLASGFDLREQCLPFMQRGAAGFVQKPFSLATLATMVRSALDRVGQRVGR